MTHLSNFLNEEFDLNSYKNKYNNVIKNLESRTKLYKKNLKTITSFLTDIENDVIVKKYIDDVHFIDEQQNVGIILFIDYEKYQKDNQISNYIIAKYEFDDLLKYNKYIKSFNVDISNSIYNELSDYNKYNMLYITF